MSLLKALALGAAAWAIGACLYVIAARISYPHELEWMTGSILDHVDRIKTGQPIYVAPTLDWVPFLYPPLYYWLAALTTKIWPGFVGCRVISIVGTLVQAACVFKIARRSGATVLWSALAVGLFFGCYSYVGCWYDIARSDSLFIAMMMSATLVLIGGESLVRVLVAALLMGIGFFAKQPALIFIVGAGAALFAGGRRRNGVVFVALAGAVVLGGTLSLDRSTGGWFSYYVFKMPAAHGIQLDLLWTLTQDLGKAFCLSIATVAVALVVGRKLVFRTEIPRREELILGFVMIAAFAAAALSRLHPGGWDNVLACWTAIACSAVAVSGTWWERWAKDSPAAGLGYALVVIQIFAFTFNPSMQIPSRDRIWTILRDKTKQLEGDNGKVFVMSHGHISRRAYAHAMALNDLITMEHGLRPEIAAALEEQRLTAVIMDCGGGPDSIFEAYAGEAPLTKVILENYYFSERLSYIPSSSTTGWATAANFVLMPRKERLGKHSTEEARAQLLAEYGLANLDFALSLGGTSPPDNRPSVEERARASLQPIPVQSPAPGKALASPVDHAD